MPRESLSGSEKRLLIGTTLILAGCLAGALRLDAVDREPQWNFPPPPPLPKPNGFDLYLQADSVFIPFVPPVDEILDNRWSPASKDPLYDYSLARRRQWLQANQMGFQLLARARRLPCLQPWPPANYRRKYSINVLVKYCSVAATTSWMEGNSNRAVTEALDGIETGIDTLQGGDVSSDLARTCESSRHAYVPFLRAASHLTAPQALQQANRLAQLLDEIPTSLQLMTTSKWVQLYRLKEIMDEPDWRSEIGRDYGHDFSPASLFFFNLTPKESLRRTLEQRFNNDIDTLKTGKQHPYDSFNSGSPGRYLLDSLIDGYQPLPSSREMYVARLRELLLALHLQAYRARCQRYPPTLNALKTVNLSHYPDPFQGQSGPFNYRVLSGSSYTLWSVGQDRRDDGGTYSGPSNNGLQTWDTERDIVLQMPLPPPAPVVVPTPLPTPAPPPSA